MTKTNTGWVIFVAAIGAMLGLISVDIADLKSWGEVAEPSFVASTFGHLSIVIGSFVGGRLVPSDNENKLQKAEDKRTDYFRD